MKGYWKKEWKWPGERKPGGWKFNKFNRDCLPTEEEYEKSNWGIERPKNYPEKWGIFEGKFPPEYWESEWDWPIEEKSEKPKGWNSRVWWHPKFLPSSEEYYENKLIIKKPDNWPEKWKFDTNCLPPSYWKTTWEWGDKYKKPDDFKFIWWNEEYSVKNPPNLEDYQRGKYILEPNNWPKTWEFNKDNLPPSYWKIHWVWSINPQNIPKPTNWQFSWFNPHCLPTNHEYNNINWLHNKPNNWPTLWGSYDKNNLPPLYWQSHWYWPITNKTLKPKEWKHIWFNSYCLPTEKEYNNINWLDGQPQNWSDKWGTYNKNNLPPVYWKANWEWPLDDTTSQPDDWPKDIWFHHEKVQQNLNSNLDIDISKYIFWSKDYNFLPPNSIKKGDFWFKNKDIKLPPYVVNIDNFANENNLNSFYLIESNKKTQFSNLLKGKRSESEIVLDGENTIKICTLPEINSNLSLFNRINKSYENINFSLKRIVFQYKNKDIYEDLFSTFIFFEDKQVKFWINMNLKDNQFLNSVYLESDQYYFSDYDYKLGFASYKTPYENIIGQNLNENKKQNNRIFETFNLNNIYQSFYRNIEGEDFVGFINKSSSILLRHKKLKKDLMTSFDSSQYIISLRPAIYLPNPLINKELISISITPKSNPKILLKCLISSVNNIYDKYSIIDYVKSQDNSYLYRIIKDNYKNILPCHYSADYLKLQNLQKAWPQQQNSTIPSFWGKRKWFNCVCPTDEEFINQLEWPITKPKNWIEKWEFDKDCLPPSYWEEEWVWYGKEKQDEIPKPDNWKFSWFNPHCLPTHEEYNNNNWLDNNPINWSDKWGTYDKNNLPPLYWKPHWHWPITNKTLKPKDWKHIWFNSYCLPTEKEYNNINWLDNKPINWSDKWGTYDKNNLPPLYWKVNWEWPITVKSPRVDGWEGPWNGLYLPINFIGSSEKEKWAEHWKNALNLSSPIKEPDKFIIPPIGFKSVEGSLLDINMCSAKKHYIGNKGIFEHEMHLDLSFDKTLENWDKLKNYEKIINITFLDKVFQNYSFKIDVSIEISSYKSIANFSFADGSSGTSTAYILKIKIINNKQNDQNLYICFKHNKLNNNFEVYGAFSSDLYSISYYNNNLKTYENKNYYKLQTFSDIKGVKEFKTKFGGRKIILDYNTSTIDIPLSHNSYTKLSLSPLLENIENNWRDISNVITHQELVYSI